MTGLSMSMINLVPGRILHYKTQAEDTIELIQSR